MIFGGNALMLGGVGDKIECSVAQVKAYVRVLCAACESVTKVKSIQSA